MCYPCSVITVPIFYRITLQAHVQLHNHLQQGGREDGEGAGQGAREPGLPDRSTEFQTTAWGTAPAPPSLAPSDNAA